MKRLFTLILALVMSVCTLSLFACEKTESQTDSPAIDADGGSGSGGSHKGGATAVTEKVYVSLGAVSLFSSETENYLERAINAEVVPANATNQAVDYSIEWANDATLKDSNVTDYVEIIPDADGSLSAKVRCYQSFGDDKIIITCTTRDGAKKASCNVTYSGLATEMTVTPSAGLTLSNSAGRGDYYELITGNDYSFAVNIKDALGNTPKNSNIEIEYDVIGSVYVTLISSNSGKAFLTEKYEIVTNSSPDFGYQLYPISKNGAENSSQTVEGFLLNNNQSTFNTVSLANNAINITPIKTVEYSYVEHSSMSSYLKEPSNMFINATDWESKKSYFNYQKVTGDYTIPGAKYISNFVPSDSFYIIGENEVNPNNDNNPVLTDNGFYKYPIKVDNSENISNSYFYITIKETVSGLTQTIKFWNFEPVKAVTLSMANIIF